MQIIVKFCGQLVLELVGQEMSAFLKTALWKMRLLKVARYAEEVRGQEIFLRAGLTRTEFQGVLDALVAAEAKGYQVVLDASAVEGRESINRAMHGRAKTGLAVKSKDQVVQEVFQEYSARLDQLMVRPLRERQKWDSFYLYAMGKAANFSVPGSGKTASVLGSFVYLRSLGLVERVVVVCPKNAFGSWRDEWKACFGPLLPCKPLCFHDANWAGTSAAAKRKELALNAGRYNLFLLNYEATASFTKELAALASEKTLLVFDEIHKVKKLGGVRAGSALEIARGAEYVAALTGTPIPNSYLDLHNMLNILYPDDYASYFGFTTNMLADPTDEEAAAVNEMLQPFFCRTNKRSLGVPDPSPDQVIEVRASQEECWMLDWVADAYRDDPLALIIRILQMESDPSMLEEELDLEECKEVTDEDGGVPGPGILIHDVPREIYGPSQAQGLTSKTAKCVNLVSGLVYEGKPVIVWCFFKKSMYNIARELRKKGVSVDVINGGTAQDEREAILDAFCGGKLQVLITNPHTLAESVSLHSVCHDAVYFEYSYNLVHLLQSKDRIHRLGLPEGQYTQYYFLQSSYMRGSGSEWSMDAKIYERLLEKEQIMLDAIDAGMLEIGSVDEDDLEAILGGLQEG